jgi:catechol 2,3-dioxygenase-like lactoylglutathione lyase family enzyme
MEMDIYDHVHFGVPDPLKAVEWYAKYMGGQPGPAGEPGDRLLFGKIRFIFLKTDNPLPSAGSAIDHIGFSFSDLDAKMKEFEAAGIKVVTPVREVPGLFKLGFIEDPWGAKIEVVQDPETLGFHHVHLRAPDPEATLKWYLDMFGGERTKLKGQRLLFPLSERQRHSQRGARHRSYRLAYDQPRRQGRQAQSPGRQIHDRAEAVPGHPHFLHRRSGGCKDRGAPTVTPPDGAGRRWQWSSRWGIRPPQLPRRSHWKRFCAVPLKGDSPPRRTTV